uniref:Putative acyl-coa synthetase n=1 Tax=Xenopsylla cheopis TaxID=163159 RepID=A0A6M2E099_XENCH
MDRASAIEDAVRVLAIIPWFHAFGFVTSMTITAFGGMMVVLPRFDEVLFLESIQNHKVTFLFTVPPLLVFLTKHPLVANYDLSSIKRIMCGAAPLSKDLQDAVSNKFNCAVQQGYGLTETTLAVLSQTPESVNKYGSCGVVAPGTLAKIIDVESGKALGPYNQGELCFKGDLIMKGYIGNPGATAGMIDQDGWLHTGDIGYYDEDEHFFIVDRLKELIKYKGYQVPPAELEALLLTHPGVMDCAVIGMPDEEAGELPLAFIVPNAKYNPTKRELQDFVAGKVSHAKRLHGGIEFIDEIPKNPTGKILRRVLRERITLPKSKL